MIEPVELPAGDGYELNLTLDAMKKINRRYEDLVTVARKVSRADFDAVCFVACAGAGISGKEVEKLERDVFEHGVLNCVEAVSRYVSLLMNPHENDGEPSGKD